MPVSVVCSNGNMLVNQDEFLRVKDLYYPYVGMENHVIFGEYCRIGVRVDGEFHWIGPGWDIDSNYHKNSLVTQSTATHSGIGIELTFEDGIYTTHDIFFRKIQVRNMRENSRTVQVFFHNNLFMYGERLKDTAQYEPDMNGVLHYRQKRYFLSGGSWEDGTRLSGFSIGKAGYQGKEGTFRDAEDGHLSGHPIEQGSVDSTIGFDAQIEGNSSKKLYHWIIAGRDYRQIVTGVQRIESLGVESIFDHTRHYWQEWSKMNSECVECLSKDIGALFRRSLLMIKSQVDKRGAIIASNDSDIMKFNKDTYTYMWPRDGALVSIALARANYGSLCESFFDFCSKIITDEGYVLHKFNPDTSLGSSWHPKYKNGKKQPPIQEDESALILIALAEFTKERGDIATAKRLYNDVVLKIGRWMVSYRDKTTGLPLPSYDLWEEQMGVFSYTCSTVIRGLESASYLSEVTGHYEDAKVFQKTAKEIRKSFLKYLWNEDAGRFMKKVVLEEGKIIEEDLTVDASMAFIWKLGVLPVDDKRVVSTVQAIHDHLTVRNGIGGIARYTNDGYHFDWDNTSHNDFPGNPWIITTLWEVDYWIATAKTKKDLKRCKDKLDWVISHANSAGILAEQMHPVTGEPLSVAPLTWSHAVYVETVLNYIERLKEIS